jgi:hypothetical protein
MPHPDFDPKTMKIVDRLTEREIPISPGSLYALRASAKLHLISQVVWQMKDDPESSGWAEDITEILEKVDWYE